MKSLEKFAPSHPQKTRILPRTKRWGWWLLLGIATVFSFVQIAGDGRRLINSGGWTLFWRFWRAALRPDLTSEFLEITLQAVGVTLSYAAFGTFLALAVGFAGGIVLSERWWEGVENHYRGRGRQKGFEFRMARTLLRVLLAVPRGIHELIWGLILLNILGLDPLTAVLAIAIPFGAITAKVFAELLDETVPAAFLTLINSGTRPGSALFYTLVPQTITDLLAYGFYRFECAVRSAAVLGIIGAGGLGYQILLSLQSLRYNQLWTLFFALCLLSGAIDLWSGLVRQQMRDGKAGESSSGGGVGKKGSRLGISLWAAAALIPWSFYFLQPQLSLLWSPRTSMLIGQIGRESFPPRLPDGGVMVLFDLAGQTLAMSVMAALLAAAIGIFFSVPAARLSITLSGYPQALSQPVFVVSRIILLFMRAIPAPIWALVLLFILFPGILPGAIALALYNGGVLGRLMAEVNENQDLRPLLALQTHGASWGQVVFYGIFPAGWLRYLAYALYRWEIAIRATVIVGLVGAGGLGRLLTQQVSAFDYRRLPFTLLFYIGLTLIVDLMSGWVRRMMR